MKLSTCKNTRRALNDSKTRSVFKRLLAGQCLLFLGLFLNSCSTIKPVQSPIELEYQNSKGGIDLEVKKYVLNNGLRLIVQENHKLPIFSYYTFYDVGGRHEGKGTTGATHFLEHMMFKGAKKYGPKEFDVMIESNGGQTNAYTNFDNTVYYESMPTKGAAGDMVEKIIDMEADRMQHLALLPESFEKERQVILEERKMRYENSPRGQLYLKTMQEIFKGTPYGGSVIGDVEDLVGLSRDQVFDYFKKFYRPDNAIIVITGDVDADRIASLINDKFGKIPSSDKETLEYRQSRDENKLYLHQANYKKHIKLYGATKNPIFMLAYPGNALGTKESFVRDIVASILGQGESSFLNQKYVTGKRPLFTSMGVSNYTLKYNGVFFFMGELLRGKNIDTVKKSLLKETHSICDEAITERTLQKTKNQYLVGYVSEIETNNGVGHFLGMRETFYQDYAFYKKEMDIYNNITVAEVKSSCKELFKDQNYIMVSVWDKHPRSKNDSK